MCIRDSNVINNNNEIDTILKDQDGIVHSLTYRLLGTKNQADKDAIKQISQSHNNNLQALDGIIKYNKFLVIILLGLVILNASLLSFFLIRKTHKISGPIYVMTGYLNEIREGRKPLFRQIREKDEFKDFYKLFVETMEKILNKK